MPADAIQVRLMSAVDLPAVNRIGGASDPYAVLQIIRTKESYTSDVCLNTVNPTWYQCFVFHHVHPSDVLSISLFDKNMMHPDVALGTAYISVGHALSQASAVVSQAAFKPSTHVPPSPHDIDSAYPFVPHVPPDAIPVPPSPSATLPRSATTPMTPNSATPPTYYPSPPKTPPRNIGSADTFSSMPSSPSFSSGEGPSYYPTGEMAFHPHKPNLSSEAGIANFSNISPQNPPTDGGASLADAPTQRSMSISYGVAPQGSLSLIVAPDSVASLCAMVPTKVYKRFQINKHFEPSAYRKSSSHSSGLNAIRRHVAGIVMNGIERAKPLHPAINSLHPIRAVFQEQSTWKISMLGVLDVFGAKRHSWNRSYPAAQKIFQGPGSVVAARLVKLQHSYLYGGAMGPLQNLREGLQEVRGGILDAKDFCEVLDYGHRRGKPRLFTYVLMPERLYMAETGAEFFRDMMSKHAMHCSASPEVVYAGELQFLVEGYGTSNPKAKLILDNNSGTYAPGKEDLPRVAEVFRRNFPGLDVLALDFRDPYLKSLQTQLPPPNQEETVY